MRRRRGFSLLELLAAVILISAFALFLMDRLAFYQEVAEKANVEFTIARLRSALRVQMATLIAQGRMREFPLLEQQNPMEWLEERPANYRVVSGNAAPEPGFWQFNTDDRTLTYWVMHGNDFQPDQSGNKRIRLRVKAVDASVGSPNEARKMAVSVRMELLEPYVWLK